MQSQCWIWQEDSDTSGFQNVIAHLAFNWWLSLTWRNGWIDDSSCAWVGPHRVKPVLLYPALPPMNSMASFYNCKFTEGNDLGKFTEVNSSEFTSAGWEMAPNPWKLSADSSTGPFLLQIFRYLSYYFTLKWFPLLEYGIKVEFKM